VLPRYTQPSQEVQILLDQLRMELPAQPPPRIKAPITESGVPALPAVALRL
jgi:hypothetical protein